MAPKSEIVNYLKLAVIEIIRWGLKRVCALGSEPEVDAGAGEPVLIKERVGTGDSGIVIPGVSPVDPALLRQGPVAVVHLESPSGIQCPIGTMLDEALISDGEITVGVRIGPHLNGVADEVGIGRDQVGRSPLDHYAENGVLLPLLELVSKYGSVVVAEYVLDDTRLTHSGYAECVSVRTGLYRDRDDLACFDKHAV